MYITTIKATLTANGFEQTSKDTLFWGVGSLVWGHTARVKTLGSDLYEVTLRHWWYNCDMDPEVDTRETVVVHGAQALALVFSQMPLWRA